MPKNIEHAAVQVINAYDYLSRALIHEKDIMKQHAEQCTTCRSHFNDYPDCRNVYANIKWKAFIHQRGASPNKLSKKLTEDLVSRFGKHGEGYVISHNEDIGSLLRK